MKTYLYRGYHRDGDRKKGVIEAIDLKDAREKLARIGVLPEKIEAATDAATIHGRHRAAFHDPAQRAEFYRSLAALLRAGLPISAAFEILLDQPAGRPAVSTREIAAIRDHIRDGSGVAQAMAATSVSMSAFESAVLESGEKTGRMPDVLAQIADYLDDAARIRRTMQTACIYPLVIIVLAVVVGVGVMGFLVPQMAEMFEESGMALPSITRFVVGVGHWFLLVILPITALLVGGLVWWTRRVRRDVRSRIQWEKRWSRLPLIHTGFELLVTTRFARTSALLLSGGLPLVDVMALSGKATGSEWMAQLLAEKAEAVRHGLAFSQALADVPVLGGTMSAWVRAGEASGDLTGMFHHAAKRHHELWTTYVQRLVTIVEPALIIVVALFVLMIALAILLPILSLNQHLT